MWNCYHYVLSFWTQWRICKHKELCIQILRDAQNDKMIESSCFDTPSSLFIFGQLLAWMHHEAYVDSFYGFVDAIEHGLYSSFIGSVELT